LLQQDASFGNNLTPTGLATAIGGSAGRHLGNLMGMEDPRVAEAKAVQEAVQELRNSGVDMNDPATYFKKMAGIFGAKGLVKQAEMAAAKALEYQDRKDVRGYKLEEHKLAMQKHYIELAEANTKLQTAMTKAQGKPWGDKVNEFIKAHADKYTPASLAEYVQSMNDSSGDEANAIRKLVFKPDKATMHQGKEIGITPDGKQVYMRPDENGKERQYILTAPGVEQPYYGSVNKITSKSDVHVGLTPVKDLSQLRGEFMTEIKPYAEGIRAVASTLRQLELARTNPSSADAARNQFMRAFRVDGNTSKFEIERSLNTGDLPERVVQRINNFLTGTLTEQKIKEMREALTVVQNSHKASIGAAAERWKKQDLSPNQHAFITGTSELDAQLPKTQAIELPDDIKGLVSEYGTKKVK